MGFHWHYQLFIFVIEPQLLAFACLLVYSSLLFSVAISFLWYAAYYEITIGFFFFVFFFFRCDKSEPLSSVQFRVFQSLSKFFRDISLASGGDIYCKPT